ncbi:MAG: Shikimate dehydrogenase [Bacteroidota bacterium]
MKQYGLIGFPLTHSFSKKYFTEKFIAENLIDCSYENFELKNIEDFISLKNNHANLIGLNVTIPYKQAIINHLDEIDATAKQVGAVNTIKFSAGKTKGFNTDIIGFEKTFLPLIKPYHTHALIFGNGGATKCVEYVLRKIGIQYQIVSRNPSINQMGYDDINLFTMRQFHVLINCTPVGMFPHQNDVLNIPYEYINSKFLCYDLIYNPTETEFLKRSKQKGAITKNGYDMLIQQAEAAWKIWNE